MKKLKFTKYEQALALLHVTKVRDKQLVYEHMARVGYRWDGRSKKWRFRCG
jgi:hypothetical protein